MSNANSIAEAQAAEAKMNLKALQRVDPFIQQILASASQVALYRFNNGEWEKTETEGALFVYQRAVDPQYGFLILNRLSTKNLVEPVTKELDFQMQLPFMLYKTKEGSIFGVWFYDHKDCENVSSTIQDLVSRTKDRMHQREANADGGAAAAPHAAKGGDIAALLSRAQQQQSQNTSKKTKESPNGGDKLLRLLSTSGEKLEKGNKKSRSPAAAQQAGVGGHNDNVAAFFAIASGQPPQGSAFVSPSRQPPPPPQQHPQPTAMAPPPMGMHPMPMAMLPPGIMPLMAGPRQPPPPMGMPPAMHAMPMPPHPAVYTGNNQILAHLMSNPGVMTAESFERQQRFESLSPTAPSPPGLPAMPHQARSAEDLESDLKAKLNMKTSSYAEAASAPKAQQKKVAAPPPVLAPEAEAPKLMSPMAFADPAAKGSNKKNRQVQPIPFALETSKINGDSTSLDITPLSQGQLAQAFMHLLKTDPAFVTRLHQAYVESLNAKLH